LCSAMRTEKFYNIPVIYFNFSDMIVAAIDRTQPDEPFLVFVFDN